ncbi:MAG: DUF488 domain-containing protein [Actinomycetota bacterium]|nr:DUF488 domain-containing protein [Actinomycetota bacterium]
MEKFAGLLKKHGIEVLVDTRSQPYSRRAPHFNAGEIEANLSGEGIEYVSLGGGLGGRPRGGEFYDAQGRVDYALVAGSAPFLRGLSWLERGIRERRIALLCSEENPSGCHRRLLVGRVLAERGVVVRHIRGDGDVQTEDELLLVGGQPALFQDAEVTVWKSIRSVLRRRRHPNSSGH